MKRIVSAVLVVGCLSVGTSSALAAPRAATPPPLTGSVACTVGATTISVRSLTSAGFRPAAADRIMSMLIATASRFPHRGLTCTATVIVS